MTLQLPENTLVFVDVERRRNRVTQIAAIAVDGDLNELESLNVVVRRGQVRPASQESENALFPRRAAKHFAVFLRRHAAINLICVDGKNRPVARLVAHNAERFDAPILQDWFDALDLFLPAARLAFCTKQRALWLFDEDKSLTQPTNYKLGTLCEFFGVKLRPEHAHDAFNDVRATVELYRAIRSTSQASRLQAA